MKVRVIDKPCLFAETVYLLYYYINGIAYTRDYERVNRKFGRYLLEKEDQGLQLAQELDRISAAVTQTLDPHQARLRYFFEKLPGTDEKTCCCLAHTMLVATPLNCTDIDSFAAELLRMFRYMSGIGFKINDMNTMGLVLEPLDPQEEPEPLQVLEQRFLPQQALPRARERQLELLLLPAQPEPPQSPQHKHHSLFHSLLLKIYAFSCPPNSNTNCSFALFCPPSTTQSALFFRLPADKKQCGKIPAPSPLKRQSQPPKPPPALPLPKQKLCRFWAQLLLFLPLPAFWAFLPESPTPEVRAAQCRKG